jgi:hypothetical protein
MGDGFGMHPPVVALQTSPAGQFAFIVHEGSQTLKTQVWPDGQGLFAEHWGFVGSGIQNPL